ncbi:MAG: hypothetical protein EKK46_14085 [Rhodocyclaceae bacterium]|nr:MAG: hypothetical protein EKK46_14085 [Rhodocyclaceae bacterium]
MRSEIIEIDGEPAILISSEMLRALGLKVGDILDVTLEEVDGGSVLVCGAIFCPGELTVVEDRYGGGYSGGRFVAWPLPSASVPPDSQGGDIPASVFWAKPRLAGKGDTQEAAIIDLELKLVNLGYTSVAG